MCKKVLLIIIAISVISCLNAQRLQAFADKIDQLERKVTKLENKTPKESSNEKATSPERLDSLYRLVQNDIGEIYTDVELVKAQLQSSFSENGKDDASDSLNIKFVKLEARLDEIQSSIDKQPEKKTIADRINIRGKFDIDLVADKNGNYFNNDYSTLCFDSDLSDRLQFTFEFFFGNGSIPGGSGSPGDMWLVPTYRGAWLTWKKAFDGCDIKFGDLRYEFGNFGYYGFKTTSMITDGTHYQRGIQLTKDFNWAKFNLWTGIRHDDNIYNTTFEVDIPLSENHIIKNYAIFDFNQRDNARPYYSGIEFIGPITESIDMRAVFGLRGIAEADSEDTLRDDPAFNMLLEPEFTITDDIWLCTSLYYQKDKDGLIGNVDSLGNIQRDFGDFYFYIEPGYQVKESFELGLPLEYHDPDIDFNDNEEFWIVPTAYIYPTDNTEIWLWAMVSQPLNSGLENATFSLGLELIVEFD
ncbi:MAG: hypothetical protein ACLFSQ_04565 [Candidatus Zixiibacteriota bacterium]